MARHALRALLGAQACGGWASGSGQTLRTRLGGQVLRASDPLYSFIFWFPFECNAKARRKQLGDGTELVQNQYQLAEIAPNLYELRRTGLVQVF
jgi:hypothetical protein